MARLPDQFCPVTPFHNPYRKKQATPYSFLGFPRRHGLNSEWIDGTISFTMTFRSQHSRLRIGSCKLLAATFLLVVAAGRGEQNEILVATWELNSVAAHPPSALNIRSWKMTFVGDGKWTYSGEMMGRFEGMKLSGAGSWNTKGSQLIYTAGANHGQSEFSVKNGLLTLSPDPNVMPDGKTRVTTTYQRVSR